MCQLDSNVQSPTAALSFTPNMPFETPGTLIPRSIAEL
jgi:hypothetical protein